jgi:hypothetical protein
MMHFVYTFIIALSVVASLNGMENEHNDRALTSSGIISLTRNVALYGKHLVYTLLPLAVECTSMQNGSLDSNLTVAVPPAGLSGSAVAGIIIVSTLGLAVLGTCVGACSQNPHCSFNASSDFDTPPLSKPSVDPLFYREPPSRIVNMREVMRSISGLTSMDNSLIISSRYGYGDPRDFFGAYGCQKESTKAIAVYLHQRCAGMPIELQMPHELRKLVGKYVRRIDKAVCGKLAAAGYDLIYYDHILGFDYAMVPSKFFWEKGFVESKPKIGQMFYNQNAAGYYDIERGSGESTDNELHDIERSDVT